MTLIRLLTFALYFLASFFLSFPPACAADELDSVMSQATRFFWVSRDSDGRWDSGNPESFYASTVSNSAPVFTAGNSSVLCAVTPSGALKETCAFGEAYSHPSQWPGGWVTWKRLRTGGLDFTIDLGGQKSSPSAAWPCRTFYLANALPCTLYTSPLTEISLIHCPPISPDGKERPRGFVWAARLRNCSNASLSGKLIPTVAGGLEAVTPDGKSALGGLPFSLAPGATVWLPMLVAQKGDKTAAAQLTARSPEEWILGTLAYWKRVTGYFLIANHPFDAELLTRTTVASLQTTCLDTNGKLTGPGYGTYPFSGTDNVRDSYYCSLPASIRDPELIKPLLAWFAQHAVRPPEPKYPAGIFHSLGNTLSPVMLAGQYFEASGDGAYFRDNPAFVEEMRTSLDQIADSHKKGTPWLFPSSYISDGKSIGDVHTGSNVCAWRAFSSFARILDEALGMSDTAAKYRRIADSIRQDLDKHNIIDTPSGPQYVEGRDRNGQLPANIHDGEESDTALMPFYGYLRRDNPAYVNFMIYAGSTNNAAFRTSTRGIVWEDYGKEAKVRPVGPRTADATFPSYVTLAAGYAEAATLWGMDGPLTEIRRMTDVNGMFWWWPYKTGGVRGQNLQRGPFESGWAEGFFSVLFISHVLGIHYDAPKKALTIAPVPGLGDFSWIDYPTGRDKFSISRQGRNFIVRNPNNHPVSLTVELDAPGSTRGVLMDGKTVPLESIKIGSVTGFRVSTELLSGQKVEIAFSE